ncbi:CocE/NonD family hydrolase [Streptomyces sp. NPDC026673]|uniref:CocE/NonD family hydrolase n=1 Tax=Streptomyces sp. NPDC026673 TaxID=3155724 RepID=UPI0033EFD3DD
MRTPRTAAGTFSAVLLATTALGIAAPAAHATPVTGSSSTASAAGTSSAPSFRFVDIPGAEGITLKGNVFTPSGDDGYERHPAVVLPSSWGLNDLEYLAQAQKLADSGYVVVSYTARGFYLSGGRIDVAGPLDVADISKVIDWTLANTPADPERIGMAGVSYGAGLTLMGAAHDPRVKAVAALSGWADLTESIYGGRTQHLQSSLLLGAAGYLTGRPSAEFQQVLTDFLASNYDQEDELIAWGKVRSPATYLDRINANGTAVMLANAWGDTIFPPNQLASFYDRLSVPKRLEFRPGDHATPEITGLFGLPNDVWSDTRRWLDHHLKGEDNGIDGEQPVRLASRSGGAYEGYDSWSGVPSATRKLSLDSTRRITANVDSGADGGIIFLSSLADQLARTPPIVSVPLLPRAFAAVWKSPRYETSQQVRGTPVLHTTVTPSAARGTFIAYLYDVNALGIGKLVTHAPYTFTDRTPGNPFGVDLQLYSTAYDLPAGHRLAVVVDTVDPLYIEHNPAFSGLTLSSPAADPSWLSVPLRRPSLP